ncbi:beta-N-acetylhexosaminidase (plasmid) [Legionella adelaidensis]|uniref:beta-N-acetylhexosaminidase n=1 Tax=Legionella adelaidensis TaxID=45056 RepID=A0A0W0R3Z9_9GAMM|nr:glycoside hydrolase family 3 N-terminal domain-containing protein [Legionella adelaidensis]KTC65742.1 glycosyl hydrolase [Legionella adelaidensis]VEH85092.1 beta-N-acetylhexosaminidase [Legionella adelaidensis]
MSLRKKIAQMLIMGFPGYELREDQPVFNWLKEGIGGVLLFDKDLQTNTLGKNIKDIEQIKVLTRDLREAADSVLPLFIAIDYEGGKVDRLARVAGCPPTIKPSEQALLSEEDLFTEARKMAATIKALGFNLNFTPVVDLNLNEQEGIIGSMGRSFSADPKKVDRCSQIVVQAFKEEGIATSYKHFPGHGSATGDTHEGFVDVTTTYNELEIEPYYALAQSDAPTMVMTAHVINKKLDSSGLPATLSKTILTDLLREKIGFEGVIISDDLQMHAISQHYSLEESLALTINAGANMLIFGNQLGQNSAIEIINTIESLVARGIISQDKIDDSYSRISQLKSFLPKIKHRESERVLGI